VLILTGISTRADLARAPVAPTWVVETFAELGALIANHAPPISSTRASVSGS
jgi:ribonucleotide monophosphatase NagD (HAD superfamily)